MGALFRIFYHIKMLFLFSVFDCYKQISGKDITESIKSEMSGDLEDALLAIGKCLIKVC